MKLTLTISQSLQEQLRREATRRGTSIQSIAVDLLRKSMMHTSGSLVDSGTKVAKDFQELLAKIHSQPSQPQDSRQSAESLVRALEQNQEDPDFNPEEWRDAWNRIEREMKERDRSDDLAEGHIRES